MLKKVRSVKEADISLERVRRWSISLDQFSIAEFVEIVPAAESIPEVEILVLLGGHDDGLVALINTAKTEWILF
ncbi:hypothetical protein E2C01_008719 [Portunus trituberculatus]|uniref:Uncharacterized protein n=1 Tax=Portunus trituberculatus TaxID=210409 RepID=A0A5B7D3L9_PORTR|nr:hypothetical protein [Portunus trituberculatus]